MYLKIPVINYKYTPLKNTKVSKKFQAEFSLYMADEMRKLLWETIKLQKYRKFWPPLTVDYLEYKKRKNYSLNIWEASGVLVNSLTVRKWGDYYLVGPPVTKKYPNTNLSILQVAKWMEYGTEKMPARPLFRRVLLYMRKNVDMYYKRYMKIKGL